jgi:hypothetical protein
VRGERVDLSLRQFDLAVEVADQAEQAVQSPAGRLAQGQLGQEAAAALAEEVGVLVLDPLPGEQGVHTVLQRRAHPRQDDPVAEQIAEVAQLARRDVRLRQQIGAKQVRERARVDRVRLHPRCSDRLRPQRV